MRIYIMIGIITAGLWAGTVSVLAKFGTSVCPILASHGFWSGCRVHSQAILLLLLYSAVVSLGSVYFRKHKLLGPFTSNLSFHLIYIVGFLAVIQTLLPQLAMGLAATGTAFQEPITTMFWIMTVLILSIFIKLNDYLMIIETFDHPDNTPRAKVSFVPTLSEQFHTLLGFSVPVLAMSLYLYLTYQVLDVGSEWTAPEKRLANIRAGAECLFVWFLLYGLLDFLKRDFVAGRLSRKAISLGRSNAFRDVCIQNLDGLFEVGKALNKTSHILTQKSRLLRGFSQFVSNEIVEKVMNEEEIEDFSEKSHAYVFFIDIRNYTEISKKLDSQQLVQWLNIYFAVLIDHFEEHGLIIDKFIGDGVLGYTVLGEDGDPASLINQTTRNLLKFFEKVQSMNEQMGAYNLPKISIGIGAQFGEVVIGLVGSKSKRQYTIVGDPVNQASRFEGLCRRFTTDFIVSEPIYDRLLNNETKELFEVAEKVQIKGIDDPLNLYIRTVRDRIRYTG